MTRFLLSILLLLSSIAPGHTQIPLAQAAGKWTHTGQSGSLTVWLEISPQGTFTLTSRRPFGGQTLTGTVEPLNGILSLRPTTGNTPMRLTDVTPTTLTAIGSTGPGEFTLVFKRD